jgi:hypothetical protein
VQSCKFYFFVLILFFGSVGCYAQGGKDSLTMAMLVPQQAVKFSPLHLINFYPTIGFSFEQKVARQVTLQLEGGYVLNYSNDWNEDFIDKRGAKVKLESRYYFFGRTDKRKIYYLGGEVYANIINFERLSRREECFDVNCDHMFIRYENAKMAYREKGFTIKAGLIKYLGRKFFFDFSSGWTIRDIEYRELTNILSDEDDWWGIWEIPNEDDRIILAPNVGARLGYRFK